MKTLDDYGQALVLNDQSLFSDRRSGTVRRPIRDLRDIEELERISWRTHCRLAGTYDLLLSAAARFGEKTAIEFLIQGMSGEASICISYRRLAHRVTQAANLFHRLGVGATDVISYVLPNLIETHEVIWGAEAAGVANAINPFLEPDIIARLCIAAKTKVLVISTPLPRLDLWDGLLAMADSCDSITAVVAIDAAYLLGTHSVLPDATSGGRPIVHYQRARDLEPEVGLVSERKISPSERAALFHTGGTTGIPKLAPQTHENQVFTAWVLSVLLGLSSGDKTLVGLPLFHCNAVIGTGLASFIAGQTILLATPLGFRTPGLIANVWKLVERHKVSIISGVPTIYNALLNVPRDGVDISSLRRAVCGAAPLSPDVFRRFVNFSGVELLEGYGLTESTVAAAFNPSEGEKRVGSVGLRLPYTEMRCAIVAEGKVQRFCEKDEIGAVVIRGPHVFPGYEGTNFSGILEDGWLDTGDLGRQDPEGCFWLTGRSKDLIIRGGHNIDPAMIENTLASREDVALVAAIGQPDNYAGELSCAYVQLVPGSSTCAAELQRWAKAHIPERASAPVHIEILDSMPLTAVGKIFKPPLRMRATERVLREAFKEAGVEAEVVAFDHPARGLMAHVRASDSKAAQSVLGGFAVPYEIVPAMQ